MREYLALNTVLQWRYNAAAVCIIFWICSEHKKNIQRHAQFKTANLNIALFENVEQRNLYTCLQVGYFINYKYAAIAARNNAIVNYTFICKAQAKISSFYWINITDQVGNANIRRSKLFA